MKPPAPWPRAHSRAMLVAFWVFLIVFALGVIEAAAAIAVHMLASASRTSMMLWNPDLDRARAAWKANATKVEPELSWPLRDDAQSGERDESGAKRNADFPEEVKPCGSAYGDSFIWGDDVPRAQGWIEQLSRLIGCRVANYGVRGYGTDQAYLRYLSMTHDRGRFAILGIFPEDIVRNVNQYRAFVGFGVEPFLVKGRFIFNATGTLQWIGRPSLDEQRYLKLHEDSSAVLPHEYLIPGTRDGPVVVGFPYTLVLTRLAMAPSLWNRVRGRTPWSDFYRAEHPSGAVPLTIAITKAFAEEASRRGAHALVVMMPSEGSFRTHEKFGESDYAPFVAAAAAAGIDVFDPMRDLSAALRGQNYYTIYGGEGHFSVLGGALVAQVVGAELKRRRLAPYLPSSASVGG